MSTTFIGDQFAAALSPDDGPIPDAIVRLTLFSDGEAANAASVAQAFKTIANHLAFLHKQHAKASDFEGPVAAFRNAAGYRRGAFDHLGFPAGLFVAFDTVWAGGGTGGSSSGVALGPPTWVYQGAIAAGGTNSAFCSGHAHGPVVGILSGDTVGDYVFLKAGGFGQLRLDNHVVLETAAYGIATENREVGFGLFDVAAGAGVDYSPSFIGFRLGAGGMWKCVTRSATIETVTNGPASVAESGLPPTRLRVEWHGEALSDNATRAVRFYIDGALVATHTTNLPLNMYFNIGISDRRTVLDAGVGIALLRVFPVRLRLSLFPEDAVI